jgi:hypothetical protein
MACDVACDQISFCVNFAWGQSDNFQQISTNFPDIVAKLSDLYRNATENPVPKLYLTKMCSVCLN